MRKGIFITGTDTGVGKTHVTALLLTELRRRGVKAAAFKPIACGAGGRRDAEIYADLMNHEQPLDVLNPIYLCRPLAPSVAAKLERRRIDFDKIFGCYSLLTTHYSTVLVEGAGGLLVPIAQNYFVADLARDLGLPVLIVARLGLGTINHTLLTVRQALAMKLKVAGIVLNNTVGGKRGIAEQTNIKEVPRLCAVPLLGVVPHGKRGAAKATAVICDKLFG
ncbi:MAG: dethiobiotin synthase [Verrucomicrobiia bacterium]